MAVENKVVIHNATAAAANSKDAVLWSGGKVRCIPFSFEVAAADDNGSVYRVGNISPMAIIKSVEIISDAIAAATVYDLGFYKSLDVGGAVIDADAIFANLDINAGNATLSQKFVPAPENVGKRAYEIAGLTSYKEYGSFDIAFTGDTVGTAAGTVAGFIEVIEP